MAESDALEISSRAMALIGADVVVEFDDGTAEASVASQLYESTLRAALTDHRWNFATQLHQCSKLVEAPPSRFSLQYQIPSNMLSIHRLEPDRIDYDLFGDKIYTSYDGELWAEGVYRVDETLMPAYFVEYFEFRLAEKFAFPITADKNLAGAMGGQAEKFKRMARLADSKQRKGIGILPNRFPLINVRG